MRALILTLASIYLFSFTSISAQYLFTTEKLITNTPIKSQDRTGTCWSFSTASFIESEVIKSGFSPDIDLSEMFVVRNIYRKKARNYIFRQGKANFSQGSLAHDLISSVDEYGIIPEQYYTGRNLGQQTHNHNELESGLKGFLDGILEVRPISQNWMNAFNAILDVYLGSTPSEFEYEGNTYTPRSFAQELGFKATDYIHCTSFMHHPFNEKFILEIPDNFSNGQFFNIPLKEFMSIVDYALINGYSLVWDGDVSEKGFVANEGIAILPIDLESDFISRPVDEIEIDQKIRQKLFESLETTDDHLMHIIGIALDQNGKKYYIIKNSWGERGPYGGYLYMSESYFKAKTISISLNKAALPPSLSEKIVSNY